MNSESSQMQMLLQKIRQYPVHVQQETLSLYLRYVLREDSAEELKVFCQHLLSQSSMDRLALGEALEYQIHDENKIKQRISQRIDQMINELTDIEPKSVSVYEKLSCLEDVCQELKSNIKDIAEKTKKSEGLSVPEMLSKIKIDSTHHEAAMIHTAEVLFDRIFESVNPESAGSYLDQSVLQVGPLKKAAMYDASKDKYQQILEYHQMGKFVQDYKVIYKRYLRRLSDKNE